MFEQESPTFNSIAVRLPVNQLKTQLKRSGNNLKMRIKWALFLTPSSNHLEIEAIRSQGIEIRKVFQLFRKSFSYLHFN
jgi:cell division inhibitor SulA